MYKYVKIFLDKIFTIFLLIAFSPLFLLIFAIYLFQGRFHFLFIQPRLGYNAKPFYIYKFRTLNNLPDLEIVERKFPLGTFLRLTSLDELPQLVNILKGDMSFVGPRPLPVEYLPYFSENQRRRSNVKPGLTGLAQIKGRTTINWDEKLQYDLIYIDKFSFYLDCKILINTLFEVFTKFNKNSLEEESLIDYLSKKNDLTIRQKKF